MKRRKSYAMLMAACTACAQPALAQDFPAIKDAQPDKTRAVVGLPQVNNLFYLPTHDEPATPATWGFQYRQVNITSKDGTRLNGWWIKSKTRQAKGTVVFSHGNAGSMGHHLGFVMWLANSGYDVLIYDYRGYGRSQGSPDRTGMVQDARAALNFAGNQSGAGKHTVISYGHSLGGAKSIAAIAEGKTPHLCAVITDATFASYREMALIVGGRLAADLVSDEYSPVEQVSKISPLPLLVIHGMQDPLVPFSQGMKLYRAAEKPKTLFEVKQGMHGDCLSRDMGAYRKRTLLWLEENVRR